MWCFWTLNVNLSLSGYVKRMAAVRAGDSTGTRVTVVTAAATEVGVEGATTAVVAAEVAMTAVAATTAAAEADLLVWGKSLCVTAP